jgi:endonuclease/exonuclease/phosphatase family metal-dependent hydrolase
MKKYFVLFITISFQLFSEVENSIIPLMDSIYSQNFRVSNINQEAWMQYAAQHQNEKLRIITFNMLYNVQDAEDKLPLKHRWATRKLRLFEYLDYAKADIIGSQELQEDQVAEVINSLGASYAYYGLKTREIEGRSDTNAIFFKTDRFELIEAETIFYEDPRGNGFSYCYFKDKLLNKNLIVINTKLSWGITWKAMKKRLSEVIKLNAFINLLSTCEPILLLGDFNTLYFLDGKSIVKALTENNLKDSENLSIFRHFGPYCSINNSNILLTPFIGPELKGVILDRIFVNEYFCVLAHAIDIAKVNGEFPSDHFPVIADILFR